VRPNIPRNWLSTSKTRNISLKLFPENYQILRVEILSFFDREIPRVQDPEEPVSKFVSKAPKTIEFFTRPGTRRQNSTRSRRKSTRPKVLAVEILRVPDRQNFTRPRS